MRNVVISGSASGIGLATKQKLESEGDRVVGIDVRDADVISDLSTPEGRNEAIRRSIEMTSNEIDCVVLSAGLSGVNSPPDATLSVNYFGSVELFDGCVRDGGACQSLRHRPGLQLGPVRNRLRRSDGAGVAGGRREQVS